MTDLSYNPRRQRAPRGQDFMAVSTNDSQPRKIARSFTAPMPTRTKPGSDIARSERASSSTSRKALAIRQRSHGSPRDSRSLSRTSESQRERRKRPSDTGRSWPPTGCSRRTELTPEEADEYIYEGANTFKGYLDDVPNTTNLYRFYAVLESETDTRNDRARVLHKSLREISMPLIGRSDSTIPWAALEQPCMALAFGKYPGTTTLNYRVSKSGCTRPPTQFQSKQRPRKIKLLQILDRLQHLEGGLDDQDPKETQDYLYKVLLEDTQDKKTKERPGLEKQMTDLIVVLTNDEWVDFSDPRHHVVAKYFDSNDPVKRQRFFHQLLLSVELYLRIHSDSHASGPKRKLLTQLPPKVAWDLAVARRWLKNITITRTETSTNKSTFSFEFPSKSRQKEALRIFASTLKWPNMDEVEYVLEEKDTQEKDLEERSRDAMSWFTGMVLPGPTLPWLLMNSLIDCDKDASPQLRFLTHMQPVSGFQYRGNTYWSYQCVVGKVLGAARGVNEAAGWIGPCHYAPSVHRTECVEIQQLEAPERRLVRQDVELMTLRTDPLGPEDHAYLVGDYDLHLPDTVDVTEDIRVVKVELEPVQGQGEKKNAPVLWHAAIMFACGSDLWPISLKYDVDFISAYPCENGPHVLYHEYAFRLIKVDGGLVDLHDWATETRSSTSSTTPTHRRRHSDNLVSSNKTNEPAFFSLNKVLCIEAYGFSDNEVFARSWCAREGYSAVVANVKETCMACAVREAYAACVSVVVLTEGGKVGERDGGTEVYV